MRHSLTPALALLAALTWGGSAVAQQRVTYLQSQEDGDGFGASLATGDFNGDGYADIAVGAPESRQAAESLGQVHVWLGDEHGWEINGNDGIADRLVDAGGEAVTGFGRLLTTADVNGDGLSDLLIGDGDGRIWLVPGVSPPTRFADGGMAVMATGLAGLTRMEGVGDVSGDGADEVAVALRATVDCPCDVGEGRAEVGEVELIEGSLGYRLGTLVQTRSLGAPHEALACDCRVDPADACVRQCGFGADLLGGRPLAQGGKSPLVVGAPGVPSIDEARPTTWPGAMYVYEEGSLDAPTLIHGPPGGEYIGRSLAWIGPPGLPARTWLLTSADLGEWLAYYAGDGVVEPAPDPLLGYGGLRGTARPVFASVPYYEEEIDRRMLVGDADSGAPVRVFHDLLVPPLPLADNAIPGEDFGWVTGPPYAVVGQMNAPDSAPELLVTQRGQFCGPASARIKLYIDGLPEPEDDDGDGLLPVDDNCPEDENITQLDRDGDGEGDVCDACPEEPWPGDGDSVCAADCATLYPSAMADASPLRALEDEGAFEWFAEDPLDGGETAAPELALIGGQGGAAGPGVRFDALAGVQLYFDPVVHGRHPTHVGLVVEETCGPVRLWADLVRQAPVELEYDVAGLGFAAGGGRFIGLKHPDGIVALGISGLCIGEVVLGDVQLGGAASPIPCRPAGRPAPDNCPKVDAESQADSDGDGLGDACDCSEGPLPVASDCVPQRTIRGFTGREACATAGELYSGPVYAELRALLEQRHHTIAEGAPALAPQSARAVAASTGVFVLVSDDDPADGPRVGDEELCALGVYVEAGGALLDARDFERSILGVQRTGVIGETSVACASANATLCAGIADAIPFTGGSQIGGEHDGQPLLVGPADEVAGVALVADEGRAVILGDGALLRGKVICGADGVVHDPALQQLLGNIVDFLIEAEGYDADADGDIEDCFGPPDVDAVDAVTLDTGGSGDWMIEVDDEATPRRLLTLTVVADPPGLIEAGGSNAEYVPANADDEGYWLLRLRGGPEPGEGTVIVQALDRDGNIGTDEIEVVVRCPEGQDCAAAACAPDDPDDDGDGICNALDLCPFVADPAQADGDGDGVGDVCDNGQGPGADDAHQGMQLQGGCGVAPGRSAPQPPMALLALLLVLAARRR